MIDKQIIIDGVDVSWCKKHGETIAGITCGNGERIRLANEIITKHKLCKDNPNCVYKQLKRKEQECEELKHKVELMMDCASCKVDEYKKTLAEIKEMCNSVENIENINSLYDAKLSGMFLQANKILQKISKCEVER